MDRLNAIKLFVRVVESGSFSAVARETGIGQPAVSKQIAALEAYLGAQLLRRTSRSMTVTAAGQTFYDTTARLIAEFDDAVSTMGGGLASPSGLLRLTVAPTFGRVHIVPRLPEFFALFPGVAIDMAVTDRQINLVEEGIDLAIRIGRLTDSTMIARRMATTPVLLVATPAYLAARGTPTTPDEIEGHACIVFSQRGEPRPWEFKGKDGTIVHHPKGSFRTADSENIRAAVLANLGLANVPGYLFSSEITSGEVRILMPHYQATGLAISAVHPAGRRLPRKVEVFLDFLTRSFAKDPSLAMS